MSKQKNLLIAVFSLLLFLSPLRAASQATQESPQGEPAKKSSTGVVIIPVLLYMPETKLGGGVGGLITFRSAMSAPTERPSSLYFYAIYTQLKQFSTQWEPEFYFQKEKYLLRSKLLFEKYPDKFWGIGSDTPDEAEENYTPRTFSVEASFQKRILAEQKLYAGLQYIFETYKMLKTDPGESLDQQAWPGSTGGTASGLGFIINWDTRDNIFTPRRGNYWQLSTYFNRKFLGSDFNYTTLKLDLRKFFPFTATHVLAFQALFQSATGEVPFKSYAKLGGDSIMRGYYSGRYRDHYLMAFQGEYRLPVWWRFGLAGFAGLGNVADKLGNLNPEEFKYSVGFGIRFLVVPKEGTNLRLDFAWGKGTSGFYFTARESF